MKFHIGVVGRVGRSRVRILFDGGKDIETGRTKTAAKSTAAGEQIDRRGSALRVLVNAAVSSTRAVLAHAFTANSLIRRSSMVFGGREELCVQRFDPCGFCICERPELSFSGSVRETPFALFEKTAKSLNLPVRHFDDLLDACCEAVECLEKTNFIRKIVFNCLLDARVQEFCVGGRVEVTVIVHSIVEYFNVAVWCWPPVDERQQRRGIRFEHCAVVRQAAQNGGTDGKDNAWGVIAGRGERVVHEPSMKSAVAIGERMHVYESERNYRGRNHRIDAAGDGTCGIFDNAAHQTLKILWPGTHVIGDWLLSLAVVCTDEAPFVTESEADESRVANNNALETFQLRQADWTETRLTDRFCPPRRSGTRRSLAFDCK